VDPICLNRCGIEFSDPGIRLGNYDGRYGHLQWQESHGIVVTKSLIYLIVLTKTWIKSAVPQGWARQLNIAALGPMARQDRAAALNFNKTSMPGWNSRQKRSGTAASFSRAVAHGTAVFFCHATMPGAARQRCRAVAHGAARQGCRA
jgi:hypothetical protein